MKIEVKGFDVEIKADSKKNHYLFQIPALKIEQIHDIKKYSISAMETIAKELIKNQQNAGNR
jgi:hypothetical protein